MLPHIVYVVLGDQTRGFLYARDTLYQLSYILSCVLLALNLQGVAQANLKLAGIPHRLPNIESQMFTNILSTLDL